MTNDKKVLMTKKIRYHSQTVFGCLEVFPSRFWNGIKKSNDIFDLEMSRKIDVCKPVGE